MNKADSERIAGVLERKGYKSAKTESQADLVVVNMCSVRQTAVDRAFGAGQNLLKLKSKNPKVKTVLTGCILKTDRKKFKERFDEIWDSKDFLENTPKLLNHDLFQVPISNGCNNSCTYCAVPQTRGRLVCRHHLKIIKDVQKAIRQGSKEILLLGQNVNDYQSPADKSINFTRLVKMINDLKGGFKFFFVSPHPKDFSDELIETLAKCEKFAKKLNLPLQSGDDDILKRMNRPYTAGFYKKLVKKIRKGIPGLNLSTDIIVGFPGETKKQFNNTLKIFKEINFDMAYISKFSPREGTLANKMKNNVPLVEKKRRWNALNNIILKRLKNEKGRMM